MNPNPVTGATNLMLRILSLALRFPLRPVAWAMSRNTLRILGRYERQAGDYGRHGMTLGELCFAVFAVFAVFLHMLFKTPPPEFAWT